MNRQRRPKSLSRRICDAGGSYGHHSQPAGRKPGNRKPRVKLSKALSDSSVRVIRIIPMLIATTTVASLADLP
jgi:hypothetical protein